MQPKTTEIEDSDTDELNTGRIHSDDSEMDEHDDPTSPKVENQVFKRKFVNPDMATCWLNSCLQLVLSALDQNSNDDDFSSELGVELKNLQLNNSKGSLDPTNVKDIIVTCEDTRIATRLSELQQEFLNKEEMERQSRLIQSCRLDLGRGQQCVRDFFVALKENLLNWPDIYSYFAFQVKASTTCLRCKRTSSSESTTMYEELPVPTDQSNFRCDVEQLFNGSEIVEYHCEEGCKERGQGEKKTTLKSVRDSSFIILILKRAIPSEEGYHLVKNKVVCTDPIEIRYD